MDRFDSMVYHRTLPWEGLGATKFSTPKTIDEAIVEAGLDWSVTARPVWFEVSEGNFAEIPGVIANVRETDNKVLGTVSNKYRLIQNRRAFAFLEDVRGIVGDNFIEVAGQIQGGRKVFMLGKLEGFKVFGDKIDPYLIIMNSFRGKSDYKACLTPFRVTCLNMLAGVPRKAKRIWGMSHTGDIEGKLLQAKETLRLAYEYIKEYPEFAKLMATTNLYDGDIPDIMDLIFPTPVEASPLTLKRLDWQKQTLYNIYTSVEDISVFHGTAWGMYNAVSDFVTHVHPQNAGVSWSEGNMTRAIEGHPTLDLAQDVLLGVRQ